MRHRLYLRERYRSLTAYTAAILLIVGALNLSPLLAIPFFPEEIAQSSGFLIAGLPLVIGGALLYRRYNPKTPVSLSMQEGGVIVIVVWVVAILSGTIPFVANAGLSFIQALFESTSGWTATGLTVINVEEAARTTLLYRSITQLAGGAGLAIIALSAITGPSGVGLSVAEGRTDQLAPHIRQSTNIVLRLYIGYIVFGIIALMLAGMNVFDSINHAFAAVATGGFSTRVESIAFYDSALIEAIILFLMLLGTVNFLTAYTLLRGKLRAFTHNGEIRLMATILVIAPLLVLGFVTLGIYPSLEQALRVAFFETIAALTTGGFTITTDFYARWSDFGWLVLIILMIIGGGTGSTTGGIKQFRIYVLYKAIRWEFQRAFLPQHVVNEPEVWQGEQQRPLTDAQIRPIALFVGLYVTVLIIGTGIIAAHGYSLRDSLFEFSSALGTVGLSGGITTPDMPIGVIWTQVFGMLLGRLEFFAAIIGILKIAYDLPKITFIPADEV